MGNLNSLYGKLLVEKHACTEDMECGTTLRKGTVFRHISASTDARIGRVNQYVFSFNDSEVKWI